VPSDQLRDLLTADVSHRRPHHRGRGSRGSLLDFTEPGQWAGPERRVVSDAFGLVEADGGLNALAESQMGL
jgi:hypothetical protein